MMRIALITLHTPTPNNFRGASALPYHLMAFRPKGVDVEVWSFNLNDCTSKQVEESETQLGVKIHTVKKPGWLRLISPAPIRLFLPKPILGYLSLSDNVYADITSYLNGANSALWIYGEDISRLADSFGRAPAVITTPDCEAMYYHRVLAMRGVPTGAKSILRYALMYHRYASMASNYPTHEGIKYHLVGREDARFLKRMNPMANVYFIRHPHYDLSDLPHAGVQGCDRIRLLVAGRYDFAMAQAADEAFEAMKALPQNIKDRYLVTFLGKGWEIWGEDLKKSGFEVELKDFVDDYAAEVSSHHIQLTPVAVGTGTKGKVLDAFANGLMVIGTPLALENIAVESGRECVEYSDGGELARWLTRLANDPLTINSIAQAGRETVLREHGREKIAEEFFHLFE